MSTTLHKRRPTLTVRVGNMTLGSDSPVVIQSMANTPTLDTESSVNQALTMASAGAGLIRFTAQTVAHAENLRIIRDRLRAAGCYTPLVADIHFNPKAAFTAAAIVEKVRINPGNFIDRRADFTHIDYTESEYAEELQRLDEKFTAFLDICRRHHTAIRLGVNHGSLSDRIMSRYGDTPEGMIESVMEFLRIAVRERFTDVVVSIKSSNVGIMVDSYRKLAAAMDAATMPFPLHVGVTEAGNGDDGRVKSAVGIGTLLSEGLGDTIRVSLTEPPENEIPIARKLVEYVGSRPTILRRRAAQRVCNQPQVFAAKDIMSSWQRVVSVDEIRGDEAIVYDGDLHKVRTFFEQVADRDLPNPIYVHARYHEEDAEWLQVKASVDLGGMLLDGFADGLWLENTGNIAPERVECLAYSLLQATRRRITRPEYIACPGCGRTLFDLQPTLEAIKARTAHLVGVKIGVMGCIVNGPGEMADADYGYVGAAPGHVTLYKGRTIIEKNIPQAEALDHLLRFIEHDRATN